MIMIVPDRPCGMRIIMMSESVDLLAPGREL